MPSSRTSRTKMDVMIDTIVNTTEGCATIPNTRIGEVCHPQKPPPLRHTSIQAPTAPRQDASSIQWRQTRV
jgi:hypothetical protein